MLHKPDGHKSCHAFNRTTFGLFKSDFWPFMPNFNFFHVYVRFLMIWDGNTYHFYSKNVAPSVTSALSLFRSLLISLFGGCQSKLKTCLFKYGQNRWSIHKLLLFLWVNYLFQFLYVINVIILFYVKVYSKVKNIEKSMKLYNLNKLVQLYKKVTSILDVISLAWDLSMAYSLGTVHKIRLK